MQKGYDGGGGGGNDIDCSYLVLLQLNVIKLI